MINLFKRKNKNTNLKEAIKFVKQQKKYNKENIIKVRAMGYKVDDMEKWNDIYDLILETLKSVKE